jgi:hypothetical protein
MSNDVIDQIRLLAPVVEATSDIERARQRRKLTNAISAEAATPEVVGASSPRRKRWLARSSFAVSIRNGDARRRRYLAGVAAAIVAAAAAALSLSLAGGASATPILKLDSYSLRLSPQFHLTAATTTNCGLVAVVGISAPTGDSSPISIPPVDQGNIATAASASGACISMVLSPTYVPTPAATDPNVKPNSTPETIDGLQAWLSSGPALETGTGNPGEVIIVGNNGQAPPLPSSGSSSAAPNALSLLIEVPGSGGTMQDLVISETGLTQTTFLSLVSANLTH